MKTSFAPLVVTVLLFALAGCRPPEVTFPAKPLSADASRIVYDTDGDGHGDCTFLLNPAGRINRIATGDKQGPRDVVNLDNLPAADCRHVVIFLDGVGYDLVRKFYEQGRLRMFHPPSRVIAPYPTLTDPALEDVLGLGPVAGMESEYYSHTEQKIVGGSGEYMEADHLPYNRMLDYRAETTMDAFSYLWPKDVFRKELSDVKRLIDKQESRQVLAYFVSSAGLGTKLGRDGHLHALESIERLAGQLLVETGGKCKFTMISDHGHSYTPGKRIDMAGHLESRNWNVTDRVKDDRDVVYV